MGSCPHVAVPAVPPPRGTTQPGLRVGGLHVRAHRVIDGRALRRGVTAMIGRLRAGAERTPRASVASHLESRPPRRPTVGRSGVIGRNTMWLPGCVKSVSMPASLHVSGGSCARKSRRRAGACRRRPLDRGVEISHLRQAFTGAADVRFRQSDRRRPCTRGARSGRSASVRRRVAAARASYGMQSPKKPAVGCRRSESRSRSIRTRDPCLDGPARRKAHGPRRGPYRRGNGRKSGNPDARDAAETARIPCKSA